jgi:hypothetical protein
MNFLTVTLVILTATAQLGASSVIPLPYEDASCEGDNPDGNVGYCIDSTRPTTGTLCTSANGFYTQTDTQGFCSAKVHTLPTGSLPKLTYSLCVGTRKHTTLTELLWP